MRAYIEMIDKVRWRFRSHLLSRPSSRPSNGPLSVAGLFRTASGIGESARACADGLERAGRQVVRVDLSAEFGQVDLPPDPRLSRFALSGGTLILHFNGPETERALFYLKNWRGSGRRVIGAWVWELTETPLSWRPATKWLSEIWVPSRHSFEALKPLTNKAVRVVPYFLAPQMQTGEAPFRSRDFTVLTFADGRSSFNRKNILAAIAAFRAARLGGDARLLLKTRNLEESPEFEAFLSEARAADPRIEVLDGAFERSKVLELIDACDVLVSMHRCEGFGLTLAEAMLRGKPVVATAWSGNMDFMDESCSIPVPFRLIPLADSSGVYNSFRAAMWADPDIDFAADALRRLWKDPQLRAQLGVAARHKLLPLTTGQAYVDALSLEP